jgi:hypothetical protein
MNRDFQQLRKILDGNDGFMTGSRIGNLRRQRKRPVPEWAKDNRKIQTILLRSFPKLQTEARQRKAAARWARFIHLYFRLGYTYRQVAEELDISLKASQSLTRAITRAAASKRTDTSQPFNLKRGRPKKRS